MNFIATQVLNVTSGLIYNCIRLLFSNFLAFKMSNTCTCRLMIRYLPTLAVMSFIFFFRGLSELLFIWNKQEQQSKCYTWIESSPEMFWDQTEATIPGPGPFLSLVMTMERAVFPGIWSAIQVFLLYCYNRIVLWMPMCCLQLLLNMAVTSSWCMNAAVIISIAKVGWITHLFVDKVNKLIVTPVQ